MKQFLSVISIAFMLFSCNSHQKTPDVSNIPVTLSAQRFENDFFKLDTNNVLPALNNLRSAYPVFLGNFIQQILGFTNQTPPDTLNKYVKYFIRDYKFVKDSADLQYKNFDESLNQIKHGFQFVKYYFPKYELPTKVITFIGPFDGYSDVLMKDAVAVGLQLHMGTDFSFYKSEIAHDLFPEYITKRFTKENIPVNTLKNIVDDLYPDKSSGTALIEQMIEKGKRLYLLDKFLPFVPDHLKIGYTEKQLKDCYTNEAIIWDFFLHNELLNISDQNITKNYIGEGPKTQELGEDAPGNIGAFCGWQIVKKYVDKNPSIPVDQVMNMDAREIYNQAKYKPKT